VRSLHSLYARFARLEPLLARARSRFAPSPGLCSARFAGHLACCSLCLPSLPARIACRLACCSRFARARPAARAYSLLCARLVFCSLRSPTRLLIAALALPAVRSTLLTALPAAHRLASCSRFARRLTCDCSLRSPLCLRLLASLAVSPTRAAPPRSLRLLQHRFWPDHGQHLWQERQRLSSFSWSRSTSMSAGSMASEASCAL